MYLPLVNWQVPLSWVAWSILGAAISAAAVVLFLLILPHDYFHTRSQSAFLEDKPLFFRGALIMIKSLLGMVLIALGIILSLPGIPRQGLLTILIGLKLVDIPGKRFLQDKLVNTQRVMIPTNKLRALFGKLTITTSGD